MYTLYPSERAPHAKQGERGKKRLTAMFMALGKGLAQEMYDYDPASCAADSALLSHILLLSCLFPLEAYSSSLEAKRAEGKM